MTRKMEVKKKHNKMNTSGRLKTMSTLCDKSSLKYLVRPLVHKIKYLHLQILSLASRIVSSLILQELQFLSTRSLVYYLCS